MFCSGGRWMVPTIRNGGTVMNACSVIFFIRSSGVGSTGSSATANRTDARLTWA